MLMRKVIVGLTATAVSSFLFLGAIRMASFSNSTTDGENRLPEETSEELTRSVKDKNGLYMNPWPTWKPIQMKNVFMFQMSQLTKDYSNIPSTQELDRRMPILTPDMREFNVCPRSGVRTMWIGHATVVVQFDNITIITDPIFSDRCFPTQHLVGPKRYRKPPCSVEELPHIDAVVISHNHYDHLDYDSVVALNNKYGENLRWYVTMGLRKWFMDTGVQNVVELDWWDEVEHVSDREECVGVKFVCTPCQHWSKRSLRDDCQTLWSSWSVIGPTHRFFFGGDTGYCDVFKQIGRKYGPFSLAAIPIGAYEPRWFMHPQHVGPDEAVKIHEDVHSRKSLGIHWGTFKLTYEPYDEPPKLLKKELEAKNLDPAEFITFQHGQIQVLGGLTPGDHAR